MSAVIKKLDGALNEASDEWKWEFSYAPKSGLQRVKITARKCEEPDVCKTLIFTEELCKSLPTHELARHILNVVHYVPQGHEEPHFETRVPATGVVSETRTLQSQYQTMRKSYRTTVCGLKTQPGQAGTHRSSFWRTFIGLFRQGMQSTRQ